MSDKSQIEWTDATWNPVTGCSKVSQGCKNCYALRDWPRLASNPKTVYFGRDFTDVETHHDRLDQPLRWNKPRRIFVNSMSDLFHDDVPDSFIAQVFAVMALAQHHRFQILTKRPRRMMEWVNAGGRAAEVFALARTGELGYWFLGHRQLPPMEWPLKNAWLGVSVEDQAQADFRLPLLLLTESAVRWISFEPLLSAINAARHIEIGHLDSELGLSNPGIDWAVVGGESGPKARPMHPDWLRSLRDQCAAAGVPFFFKQWGEWWEVMSDAQDDHGRALTSDHNSHYAEGFDPQTDCAITLDGRIFRNLDELPVETPARWMTRIGKKFAGRELDGRTHDDLPGWTL